MVWIFALGMIALMVYQPGFRKVMFWIAGIGGGLVAIAVAILFINDYRKSEKANEEQAREAAAWNAQHPKGCAEFQPPAGFVPDDDRTLFFQTEGHCMVKDGKVVAAK